MNELKSRVLTALAGHFPDKSFSFDNLKVLHKGRFANAVVLRYQDDDLDLVIKDFSHCPWPIRRTAGRFFIGREAKAMTRLKGIDGVVPDCYQLNELMLAYPFIEGESLRAVKESGTQLPRRFFVELERMVAEMHRRGVVHLDLRNLGNVLLGHDGKPHFIDFQSSMSYSRFPNWVQGFMRGADLSGVYKAWEKVCDEPLSAHRARFFDNYNILRKRWIFRGYPLTRTANKMRSAGAQLALAGGEVLRNMFERIF
ncbi:RIO1 family regulatory kinase/ATPase domain-containing protein [Gallaecimonas mangrovi]|uniref:RIO1 family regulatory kinase/ATPase domain-containing protein n=1 Tax=Gallaecimonas mangrovi TaxID=2291597 RepID=UPI000E1FCEF3|nr:RIO1 family regulatory kinase/ATPase [Gallaecimonas mangrovi]